MVPEEGSFVSSPYSSIRGRYKKSQLVLNSEFRFVHVLGLGHLGDIRDVFQVDS